MIIDLYEYYAQKEQTVFTIRDCNFTLQTICKQYLKTTNRQILFFYYIIV